jgi:hypothetical protein
VLSAALVLVPLIFAFTVVFPVGNSTLNMLVVAMYLVFAVGFWFPVAKYNKVRKNTIYLLGVVAAIIVPVLFAFTQVFPLINSNAFNAMFMLMHFVLASGLILAYSHRAALKKLF